MGGKYSWMAIVSFILAIVSLLGVIGYTHYGLWFIIPSVLAVVLGFISRKNKNLKGKTLAKLGIIFGFITIGLYLLYFIWEQFFNKLY